MANFPDLSQPIEMKKSDDSFPDLSKPNSNTGNNISSEFSRLAQQNARRDGSYTTQQFTPMEQFTLNALAAPFWELKGAFPAFNTLSRITGSTGLNTALAQNDPNNQNSLGKNLGENAAINSLIEAVPYIGKGLSWATKGIRPQSFLNEMMNRLGSGAQNLEENAKSLAKKLKDSFDARVAESNSLRQPVLNKYGSQHIYPEINPSGIHAYREMPEINLETSNSDLKKTFSKFKSEPTLQNAHDLQSQLFGEIAKLKRQTPSSELTKELNSLYDTREGIKNGIDDFLKGKNETDALMYKAGSDLFRDNAAPYLSDRQLESIVRGKETNPKNIHNIFEYPTNIVTREGEEKMGPINKVINDLPDSAKEQIIYSKIGGHAANQSPESAIKNIENARGKGFSNYITPNIEKMLNNLSGKVSSRNLADITIGGLLGHVMNFPGSELAGAAIGYGAPKIMNSISNVFHGRPSSNALFNLLKQAYRPAARTIGVNAFSNKK